MQSEYRRADHLGLATKAPTNAGAFRLTAYGQTTERSSWVRSLGFPRGSRLGPTTSSKANLERAASCGSFPGMWSCRVEYATISCRRGGGRANPPTLLAKATPARRGPEPRSIRAPGNFIRRRLLIVSPGPVALPFGSLRPFFRCRARSSTCSRLMPRCDSRWSPAAMGVKGTYTSRLWNHVHGLTVCHPSCVHTAAGAWGAPAR
jgi:hypothetical protein